LKRDGISIPIIQTFQRFLIEHTINFFGRLFFIADINEVLGIFEHASVLGYADDLKLYMMVGTVEVCHRLQSDLGHLNEWCLADRFDLNAGKFGAISFLRNVRAVQFEYRIGGRALGRVEEIRDLSVLLDSKMTLLSHIEAVISKSSRMLVFIKRVSREFSDSYTYKVLYISLSDTFQDLLIILGFFHSTANLCRESDGKF
jgi:hypothetical protein